MKSLFLLLFPSLLFGQFTNELIIPATLTGITFELTIDESTYQFMNGLITETVGFNGDFLSRTLIFEQGDEVDITVNNNPVSSQI